MWQLSYGSLCMASLQSISDVEDLKYRLKTSDQPILIFL